VEKPVAEVTFYKFDEEHYLGMAQGYIKDTYEQHYSDGQRQAIEDIMDAGLAHGFLMGNIIKYASRLGKKGTPEDWEKDLYKIIHYAVIALYDMHHNEFGDRITDVNESWTRHPKDLRWPKSRSKDQDECDKNWRKWAKDNPQYFEQEEPLFYETSMGWVYKETDNE
jgi:hypothetical protein